MCEIAFIAYVDVHQAHNWHKNNSPRFIISTTVADVLSRRARESPGKSSPHGL